MMDALKTFAQLSKLTRVGHLPLAAIVIASASASSADACPMCKAALGSGADHFINAWGISIVFMLSMPFLLMGSLSAYMYYLVRRARAEQAAKQVASASGGSQGNPFAPPSRVESRERETMQV
jgi:hypothetical protein